MFINHLKFLANKKYLYNAIKQLAENRTKIKPYFSIFLLLSHCLLAVLWLLNLSLRMVNIIRRNGMNISCLGTGMKYKIDRKKEAHQDKNT